MKGYIMLVAFLGLSIFAFYLIDNGNGGRRESPRAARSLEELPKTGNCYQVTGADIQSLNTTLIGKQIRLCCTILSCQAEPIKMVRLTTGDRLLLVNVMWKEPDQVLDDLLSQLQAETVRPGDPITVFATVENLEERPATKNGTGLPNTCSLTSVQKWQRGR